MDGFESLDVAVAGGALRVARCGQGGRAVLALHGLAGSHVSMTALGRRFGDDCTVLAPDLRGRGASAGLPGPYGLEVHVDDCLAVLDHLGVERAALVGHSMGAFIAVRLAARRPERVESLTLIDGGLPLPIEIPEGQTADDIAALVLGPLVANLERTFLTPEAYMDEWRAFPGFGGHWDEEFEARIAYEITGEPGEIRSRISTDAVRGDWSDALLSFEMSAAALESIRCPLRLFRAPRGMLDQPAPTLSDELVGEWSRRIPQMVVATIDDTNHLTIGILDHATAIIAGAMQEPVIAGS